MTDSCSRGFHELCVQTVVPTEYTTSRCGCKCHKRAIDVNARPTVRTARATKPGKLNSGWAVNAFPGEPKVTYVEPTYKPLTPDEIKQRWATERMPR